MASKKRKLLLTVGITVLFVLMFVTAVVFLLASTVPANYQTYQLTQKERKDAATDFVGRHGAVLVEKMRVNQPFQHTITEEKLNLYLASLDEIAFLRAPRRGEKQKTGEIHNAMDKAGLADPVVHLDDGVITFMVRTQRSNKVVSMDIGFDFPDPEHIRVALREVRIGRMPVPPRLIEDSFKALKQAAGSFGGFDETSAQNLDAILAGVLAAVGEGPLPTTMQFGSKRTRRIKDIVVEDGKLTVDIEPVFTED